MKYNEPKAPRPEKARKSLKNSVNTPKTEITDPNFNWITAEEPHKALIPTMRSLIQAQSGRLWANAKFFALYSNSDWANAYYGAGNYGRSSNAPRLTVNYLKIFGDSLAGKLVQNNSRVTGQAVNGDFTLHHRIKKLDQMLDGEFARGNLYYESMKVALDAVNVGTGYLYVYDDDGKVGYERVFPNEVFVDELQAAYDKPNMIFRIRYMKKEDAIALWPKFEDQIKSAASPQPLGFAWTLQNPGMIEVVEAWSLTYGARKGRHVLAVSSATIIDEDYDKDCLPFVVFKASDRPLGWYGQGMIEQIGAAQVELNKILYIMSRSAHLGLAPFWVVASGANINIEHLRNDVGHIVTTDGPAPQWVTNQPFSQAAPQYVAMLKEEIGSFYGINSMESQGALPLNRLDSRKALVEFQDMGATRQTIILKNWEKFFLDTAYRTIEVAQCIAKEQGTYPVVTKNGPVKSLTLDWKDYEDLTKDNFRLTLAPVNLLSTTPAAKKNDVIEMMQAVDATGRPLITAEQGLSMLQGPADIASIVNEVAAPENYIDMIIEKLMDGEYVPPDERLPFDRAIKRVRDASFQAQVDGAGDDIVDLFERWLGAAADLQNQLAPMVPQMGMPGELNADAGGGIGQAIALPPGMPPI